MNIKGILKSNRIIRCIGKRMNVRKQFMQDAHDFNKYYVEKAELKKDYRYSIMLLVHSLEKGMCFKELRPFGIDKVAELMKLLDNYPENHKGDFEYKLGIASIYSWKEIFEAHNWTDIPLYSEVCTFFKSNKRDSKIIAGAKQYTPIVSDKAAGYYEKFFLNRHSVRDYRDEKIKMEDIQFALKCFIETPTACNRQMCHVYYVEDPEITDLLNRVVVGISGFNKQTVQFFVITYDLASFAYSGERQQGMFNAGLCTMSFVNGLHAKGIGSCCLQWSNKNKQDVEVRKKMKIRESERIGIVIGAGYYLKDNTIPCSIRKRTDDIFSVI